LADKGLILLRRAPFPEEQQIGNTDRQNPERGDEQHAGQVPKQAGIEADKGLPISESDGGAQRFVV
jgi:hypothetical protein